MICRVLPHAVADGPGNMALDEALLDATADDPSTAVLRTYTWSPPTLSLGYFQGAAEAGADPVWRSVPLVRRPTGGGAIWHEHDLTYALVVPRDHPRARRSVDLYHAVHGAIAALLQARGVAAEPRGPSASENPGGRPFLCFTDRDPEDIVFQSWKIVGSAQRRRGGAVLQHGSLLLRRSGLAPNLPGVGDFGDFPTDPSWWSKPLCDRLLAALDLDPRHDEVAGQILSRVEDLRQRVYSDPSWTRRR